MPRPTKTILLSEPITGHHEVIREVVVRPPTLPEYGRIGEPYTWIRGADGQAVYVEQDGAISAYIEACIVEPKDKLLVEQIELRDAFAIKEAVLDFFHEARQAKTSPISPTISS